jgi:hypothetical protein
LASCIRSIMLHIHLWELSFWFFSIYLFVYLWERKRPRSVKRDLLLRKRPRTVTERDLFVSKRDLLESDETSQC